MKLCRECEISVNFHPNKRSKVVELSKVKNTADNVILSKIMEQKHKLQPSSRFKILVDGSRYGIRILSNTGSCVYLEQYFLHYDGKSGKLTPVWVRYVRITF